MPTADQLEIQSLAREFAEAELRPHAASWDERRSLDDEVFAKLAELGFMGMLVAEEHGGLGFDHATYLLVLEELARGDASVALSVAIHNGSVATLLGAHGSSAQKERWLPALASGEMIGAFAPAEPGGGDGASAVEVRAEEDGDGWRLGGETRWVTNGARAGVVVVFARVGDDGPAAFLVTPASEGYSVGDRERTLGLRASEIVSVALDGVAAGPDALIGDVESGPGFLLEAADVARVGTAAIALGIGGSALEHASAYALEREQFGQPIARFGAIQDKLARMAERLAAGRALTWEAASSLDAQSGGAPPPAGMRGVAARAALAKVSASEAATWIADEAIQIFGGYGYMRHYPVEKLLRDAKGTEILDGTSDFMRRVIAREVLRGAGEASE